MTNHEKEIIKTLADCDMNVLKTARVMHYHRSTIAYHLRSIKKKTGMDPLNFYDLVRLLDIGA